MLPLRQPLRIRLELRLLAHAQREDEARRRADLTAQILGTEASFLARRLDAQRELLRLAARGLDLGRGLLRFRAGCGVVHRHRPAVARQVEGERAPDPLRRAGDQRCPGDVFRHVRHASAQPRFSSLSAAEFMQ